MTTTIALGNKSNYTVTVTMPQADKSTMTNAVLLEYQKEATKPGFRKGHVPLDMIAKMVNPGQLTMALVEDILQSSIQSILKDHADISWIGQPYSLDTSLFDVAQGDCVLTYILDYFPVAIEQDKKRETIKPITHDSAVSDEDINNTIQSLLSSYATYEDAESISETTMVRVKATYASQTGEDLSSYTKLWYINAEELVSSTGLLKALTGAKAGETITVAYSDIVGIDGLVPKKITTTPDTVSLEIIDLKTKVLPALTQEFIETTFKGEEGIISEETLRAKITETLSTNKAKSGIMDAVNAYTNAVLPSFSVVIPQTIEDEEYKNRLEQLKEHFQGEKGLKMFLDRMGEEERAAYLQEIKDAGIQSLQKYVLMKHICTVKSINIDREATLAEGEVEQKIYDALV